jgi:hypothetical protein
MLKPGWLSAFVGYGVIAQSTAIMIGGIWIGMVAKAIGVFLAGGILGLACVHLSRFWSAR